MFRGKESSNRIKLSSLVQELLNFGVSGSLRLWGVGGWVDGGGGWGGGWMGVGGGGWVDGVGVGGWGWGMGGRCPTHMYTCTRMHTCTRTHMHAW